jgi:hypothetical protein
VEDITYTVIENAETAGAHKTHFAMVKEEDSETQIDDGQVRERWGGGGLRGWGGGGMGEGRERSLGWEGRWHHRTRRFALCKTVVLM